MELEEEKCSGNPNDKLREIFSDFLVQVVKLEELVELGRRFLIGFQQSLEFLRRPSILESSELVQTLIKANETRKVKSYVEAGCVHAHDSKQKIALLNVSLYELQEHLINAKGIIKEVEELMENTGSVMRSVDDKSGDESEVELRVESEEKISDAADYGAIMAVIYSMVKQDYVMQERIVSSLSLKSSAGELEGYCLMWSLRPFVDDQLVRQALRHVR